jgi:EAL domain-containing protein (putative c-di-GMP-specific phosphodiesterase class I)
MLKIERALVGGMADDEYTAWGVRTLVMTGRDMRMDVVAKGVETGAQAGMLKGMGCRFAQGYYFGEPAGAEVTEQIIYNSGRARK